MTQSFFKLWSEKSLDKYLAGKTRSAAFLEPFDGPSSLISLKNITSKAWVLSPLYFYKDSFKTAVKS
jgi:hypothetical protein